MSSLPSLQIIMFGITIRRKNAINETDRLVPYTANRSSCPDLVDTW